MSNFNLSILPSKMHVVYFSVLKCSVLNYQVADSWQVSVMDNLEK